MRKYDHLKIETKWQKEWQKDNLYTTDISSDKPKCYVLDMFPYPSGEGLHVGHPKGYIATDVYSRFKKMNGFEVLHPMGWDAFGLPAENYAIKNKVHPRVAVGKNIENFKSQLSKLGFNYDWSKEINTTDPEYYKWTQWIFLQLFKKGLAFESYEPINWCPSCLTGLANEDLESDGTCERCGSVVEKKPMRQWVLQITKYADRLLDDLSLLKKWPEHIKESQRNWIGKSEGALIKFAISNFKFPHSELSGSTAEFEKIEVFTTRPDTLFGVTYMVLAPEHELVKKLDIENRNEVDAYIQKAARESEMDRLDATKEKTGVELKGIKAINPANNEEIPVYIADYVLADYGTGAIMAVPAHDERDFEFAKKFGIEIKQVIAKTYVADGEDAPRDGIETLDRPTIDIIIEHPTNGTFLLQREKDGNRDLIHFVGGGTDGELDELALARELEEETGFSEFELIAGPINTTFSIGYRHSKNKNQCGISNFYHIKLKSVKQKHSEVDDGKHTIEWVEKDKIADMITWRWHRESWEKLIKQSSFSGTGILINSDTFNGMDSEEAKLKITESVGGKMTSTYRLNDWVFSRQRYWGEPIPIIHCEKCGAVPVPEDQLPVVLPEVKNYEPTGTGESPLANIDDWVNTACPTCGGPGKRETNTMPQWAGSSWYYLRFIDPKNTEAFVDAKKERKWMPVDVYVGGDHAVRHLIYARFWHKFLYDLGVVSTKEPFERLEFLGFILSADGRKMSKRWGNIINPDDIVKTNGADAMRVYEMFMSPFENTTAWSTDGLVGAQRFLERVWKLAEHLSEKSSPETQRELHKTIKKVEEDIENFKFNTAIAQMMTFLKVAHEHGITMKEYQDFLQLLAPFAPHLTEELWQNIYDTEHTSIHRSAWPLYDETLTIDDTVTVALQVNGKLKGEVCVSRDAEESEILDAIKNDTRLHTWLNPQPHRIIYVKNRLLNIVR